ncbi:MAG: F0F1 ATP synthase subunit gamma, partial [Robiginitomaculum sp.]|nr:F0F1 ATP synthase subunit gamma [Robiginitomaculum sp.]
MKINGNEIRPGNIISHQNGLWVAVKTNAVKPGKGGAFNQVELKNLIDGRKLNERFRASETVEKILVIVITYDKGLCGGFNSNVIKNAKKLIENSYSDLHKNGKITIATVGKKGNDVFKKDENLNIIDT